MLRITIDNNLESLTFRLEGKLAGPWVRVLEDCWHSIPAPQGKSIRFDLTDVTFIDLTGKRFLAAVYRQGAELSAADCFTKAIVAAITHASLPA